MMETIGVIGGGQLGRMFALDAKRMGYGVITLDPVPHSPCGQVSDEQIVARYDDFEAIDELGRRADIVTYEFENIAIESVERLENDGYNVTPGSGVLRITQHRLLEKRFVRSCGIPVAEFEQVDTAADIDRVEKAVGYPAVFKTVRGGYDGKGQWVVRDREQARLAVEAAAGAQLIAERFVPFICEISVICTRNSRGDVVTYPVAENVHDRGVLFMSIVPARVDPGVARRAEEFARTIARKLEIVGTFCVEFFVGNDGTVLVNEIAPRPHNSGHYTIDATPCSQYEQHVRAICALPLSPPQLLRNAIMVNILGTGEGDHLAGIEELLANPAVVLHLYGKKHAVNRRKMGHFTMLLEHAPDETAIARAKDALGLLHWSTAGALAGR